MKWQSIAVALAAAFAAASVSAPASAADCAGYDILVTQSAETVDVGNGMTSTVIRWWSVLTTDDPKSPYNLATGECQGTILTTPDGKAQATGYCARRNKDKDTQSIQWTLAPGAEKGEWRATGGSGVFAGRDDRGWFQNVNSDGKMNISRWAGKCR